MTITLIPLDHFSGGAALTVQPGRDDTRSLVELIREIQTEINNIEAGVVGDDSASRGSIQVTAASDDDCFFIAPADGEITSVQAVAGTAAAAGESMDCDVEIGGATCLSAPITLDDAAGTTVQAGTLGAGVAFSAGDKISAVRTYVAGCGPTPMLDTLIDIGYKLTPP